MSFPKIKAPLYVACVCLTPPTPGFDLTTVTLPRWLNTKLPIAPF
ncbi:hypothetical protein [Pedobacter mucosus]|nr:hypothetical protein [Pedobacter mucosus]